MRLKVDSTPSNLVLVGGKRSDKFSAGGLLEEVDSVQLSDTAKSGHANL
jgi:hypothetical protein